MTLPLYIDHGSGAARPNRGHTGLWYTRFFDRFDQRQGWGVPKEAKKDWIALVEGPCGDQEALARACLRQLNLAQALNGQSHAYRTRWHFATGLGLPHPVENGFTWHPTLGVPYLCGAAVKGLVKAWVELIDDQPEKEKKARLDRWFGDQENAGSLIFFDAFPAATPMLTCDVMTPHMGDWYQKGGSISDPANEPDKVPADWHDPVPVPFLVVREATFLFSIAPRNSDLTDDVAPASEALEAALKDLGAGAKTAVGYGHMRKDDDALRRLTAKRDEIAEQQAKKEKIINLSPFERSIEEVISARQDIAPHVALIQALDRGRWSVDEHRRVAEKIRELMQATGKWPGKSPKDKQRTAKVRKLLGGKS